MRHELVICTKDRPHEVARCLQSVATQSIVPDRIVVIDSSAMDATATVAHEFARNSNILVAYRRSHPSLTLQRNTALRLLNDATEIVHFVDDDAILEPDYLRHILDAFEQYPRSGGVGGRISNLPTHTPQWYRRLFLLNSRRQGVLLRSGINVLSFTGNCPRCVDWLSGCSMSYRLAAIHGLRFDETRLGNGVGEDVDFSARVAARTTLIWTPLAVIEHRQSSVNREAATLVTRREIRSRWRLASDSVASVRHAAIIYSIVGEVLISLVKGGRYRSPYYVHLAAVNVLGLVDVAKGRPV